MNQVRTLAFATSIVAFCSSSVHATPTCTELGYGAASAVKPNKLYLYFPTADDASYPEFGVDGLITSPAHRFDVSELSSYTGTATALKNGIFDVVTDDYCEFNVEVLQTTSAPAAGARRNTVAIGTDAQIDVDGWTWGLAQAVDTNDSTSVDFARVWAGTYQGTAGLAGGALNGANSTLERWARSIGGTAAHEGGHNYGLSHSDGLTLAAGEDALTRHVMASGSHYSDEQRAGYRRHFSDHEYSVLAANVGLSVQTMWNWDMINPNAQTAVKLRIHFLSTQPSLTVQGAYTGSLSPWSTPSVSAALGTQSFKGVVYNRFDATWSTGQAWGGGTPGQVDGGETFHVGTGFSGVNYNLPDPIIITGVDLIDASNNVLALHPRYIGFDAGTLDASDGTFAINAFNFDGGALQLANVRVQFLPRLMSIDAMLPGMQELFDVFGEPLRPWSEAKLRMREVTLKEKQDLRIPIAKLSNGPQFIQRNDKESCEREDRTSGRDVQNCVPGVTAALFPSTSTYISALVIDPNARHWDPKRKEYVTGPVRTQIFYQIAGRSPDLNRNKVDDFEEIANDRSKDSNKDGVIDDAEKSVQR